MGRGWEREKGLPTRLPSSGAWKKETFCKDLLQKRKEVYQAPLELSAKVYVLILFIHSIRQCALSEFVCLTITVLPEGGNHRLNTRIF